MASDVADGRDTRTEDSPSETAESCMQVWSVVVAYIKYFGWLIFTKIPLGVLYVSVMADGLRYLIPALGQKLHKIPGLSFFNDYEATYRLDLAQVFSVFLLVAIFWLWPKILRMWLFDPEDDDLGIPGANPAAARLIVLLLGMTILGADTLLFYTSMTQVVWGGSMFSLSALIATVAYVAVLIFVSLVSITLHQAVLHSQGALPCDKF